MRIIALITCIALRLTTFSQVGSVDPTFGSGGAVKTNFSPAPSTVTNRLSASVVQTDGKLVAIAFSSAGYTAVMRFTADGVLDNTFDGDGMASLYNTQPTSVALQSDGKIVVGGYISGALNSDFSIWRFNTDGSADITFDGDGMAQTDILNGDACYGVAVQADGKIVAAGVSTSPTTAGDFCVVRYNTNGTLDNTFGTGGKTSTDFGSPAGDQAYAVAIQSDGKIVLAGRAYAASNECALARYNTNGTLDATFGSSGKVITAINSTATDQFSSIAIQADGKIVCAGFTPGAGLDQLLVRYTTTGTLDNTFGSAGIVITAITAYNDQATSLLIQPDGKILTAGWGTSTTTGYDSYTARFTTTGALDVTYNTTGIKMLAYNTEDDTFGDVVLQNGKILAVGYTGTYGSNYLLARYNADGSNDATFGSSGNVSGHYGGTADQIFGMVVQPDGKLVVAGQSTNTNADFALARYNPDGTPDFTFNSTGKLLTSIGSGPDQANAVALQPDGKIVAAGVSSNIFAVVRYNADGTLDNTFSGDGIVTTTIGAGTSSLNAVAIQPDGKIVVAGYAFNGTNNDFALVRFNTDGSLDLTFDGDGKVTTALGAGADAANAIAIQPDGKIVVAGYAFNGTNNDFAVARYNINGSLDNTFGSSGKTITPVGSGADQANAIVVQTDGKTVVAGYTFNGTTNNDFALVRYTTAGVPDNTFGSAGKVITPMGSYHDQVNAMDLQTDGRIVVAGFANNGAVNNIAVARYTATGALDATFGTAGKTVLPLYPGATSQAAAAKVNGNRIYIAGWIVTELSNDFALTAINSGLVSLPLTFLSFTGRLVDREAHLLWVTANEYNTAEFVVEKSADGLHFVEAGTVPSVSTTGNHQYKFTDRGISSTDEQTLFYRLKQKDQDARFTYSSLVILRVPGKEAAVNLFPNPVIDKANLVIDITTPDVITCQIIRNDGAIIRSTTNMLQRGSNSLIIDTQTLRAGAYTLAIKGARIGRQIRFLKK